MNFQSMLSAFIGHFVEVAVPNQLIDGTLTSVQRTLIELQGTAPPYSPAGPTIIIPDDSINYVRIVR